MITHDEKEMRLFIINVFFNLHCSIHVKSCFKGCKECRFDLPGPELDQTIIQFIKNPKPWFNWIGEHVNNNTFNVELKRHIFDAFMNIHNPATTKAVGCNNNVAFGNIKRMFYATTYNSKGTQEEDSQAFVRVSKVISRRIQKLKDDGDNNNNIGEGISRLYGSIITHCQAHIISAPLARYIVTNGSRFKFSHDFSYIPIFDFQKYIMGNEIPHILRYHNKTYLK